MDLNSLLLLGIVAGAGVGVTAVAWVLARLASAIVGRTASGFDDQLAAALRPPLAVFAGLLTCGVGLVLLGGRIDADGVEQARRVLMALLVILAVWGFMRVLRAGLERFGERRPKFQAPARVGRRILSLVLFTLAFLVILSTYGVSITPVLTGLGIAGLAVALALQDTGANFFAGIWIQTGRALQPGHYIRIEGEQGLEGYVEEVGWRVTRVRTLGGNSIVVPNNKLAQAIVTDFDLPQRDMSVVMTFRTGLEADPEKVIQVLVEEARAAYGQLPKSFHAANPPFAQLSDFEEYCMRFSLIIRIPEFVQQWNAQDLVRKRVLTRFSKEGIRIPFPTRHNFSESVEPGAQRVAGAPGGLAPRGRPSRRRQEPEAAEDPRALEAERAKQDIAALQREKKAGPRAT